MGTIHPPFQSVNRFIGSVLECCTTYNSCILQSPLICVDPSRLARLHTNMFISAPNHYPHVPEVTKNYSW